MNAEARKIMLGGAATAHRCAMTAKIMQVMADLAAEYGARTYPAAWVAETMAVTQPDFAAALAAQVDAGHLAVHLLTSNDSHRFLLNGREYNMIENLI